MQIGASNNAMTEIALALVMAFFSIMVLALIFMSAGMMRVAPTASPPIEDALHLRDAVSAGEATGAKPVSRDGMVVYYAGRFYDGALAPLDPGSLGTGDRVLAVPPELPLSDALSVKAKLPAGEVTVTTLDGAWLERLKELVE